MKIILSGLKAENNFGCPSLMHGAEALIKEIWGKNVEIIYYQFSQPQNLSINDFDYPVKKIPYNNKIPMIWDAIKVKMNIYPKDNKKRQFFLDLKSTDIISNLFGICFCDNFKSNKSFFIKPYIYVIWKFPLCFIGKLFKKKTVKGPASFGPIISKTSKIKARFASNYIFNRILAREKESEKQMKVKAKIKKDIPVFPDLANMMSYNKPLKIEELVGISISHQIIKQWNSTEKYIDCIKNLIEHIRQTYNYEILLIPNEFTQNNDYHDIHVANDIFNSLDNKEKISIIEADKMTSTQLKNEIAKCEVVVASRYHSCVAALSSGVPTLVIGWHHKYIELLEHYGQEKWILSNENCTSEKLIKMFDEFWENKDKEKEVIKENYKEVRRKLIEAGKIMFTK